MSTNKTSVSMKLKLITFVFLSCLIFNTYAQNLKANYSFIAKGLEWKGVAVQDNNYSLWGCAPIQGNESKTHIFIRTKWLENIWR